MAEQKNSVGMDAVLQTEVLGPKKVLVVDDNYVNRQILNRILKQTYTVLQAENGQIALDLMRKNEGISAVLLDIDMPVMDGYEFMEILQETPVFAGIPIIVTTANNSDEDEILSLKKGASDFIRKPYNPEIVLHHLESIIRLRETSVMLSVLKHDSLTGVYSKDWFYQEAQKKIIENPGKNFFVICSDIKDFKILNEMYGRETADQLLCILTKLIKSHTKKGSICGRLSADVFAVFDEQFDVPFSEADLNEFLLEFEKLSPIPNVNMKFGVYEDIDISLPVTRIVSRALVALEQIKNFQLERIAFFRDWEKKQLILNEFDKALKEKQFKMFLQPKFDISRNCIGGAEALVRWFHPKKGVIPPNNFIPLFEEKGRIFQLDFYIWEEACKFLSNWLEKGHRPIPVSVNMSRIDINIPNLVEKIVVMTDKYRVPRNMLHFEILERAYSENSQKVIEVCKKLREYGYKIEMDDFGTGNSSLNMLSILPIDYLKLDMNFLTSEDLSEKRSILPSIVSLASGLELETVAEGVEKESQVKKLKRVGCRYIQGFYYSKPLPVTEFEEYFKEQEVKSIDSFKFEPEESAFFDSFFKKKEFEVLLIQEEPELDSDLFNMVKPYIRFISKDTMFGSLEYLKQNSSDIDLILLNSKNSIVETFGILEQIKNDSDVNSIPVILMGNFDSDNEFQAIMRGADSILARPYRIELLLYKIKTILQAKNTIYNDSFFSGGDNEYPI